MTGDGERLLIVYPERVSTTNRRMGRHWSSSTAERSAIRGFFAAEARRANLGPWPEVHVEFIITRTGGTLPDTDAVALAAKPALDGLVDGGLIPDDTGEHVRSITFWHPAVADEDSLRCLVIPASSPTSTSAPSERPAPRRSRTT